MVTQPRWLRSLALAVVSTLVASTALVAVATTAEADTAPTGSTAATVSSDALPTVQIDGVAWTQVIVGNTVYVGGSFANSRPAGAAVGVNQTPAANMLAYNLTTGALIPSFAPVFNAQVKALAASADGSTIYAAGNFTTVNGLNEYRVVSLNAATGAVNTKFKATVDSPVTAIAVSSSTVFFGGAFTTVNSTARARIAAVNATTGAVTAFDPALPDNAVKALVVSPDGSKIVIGGSFSSVNGQTQPGRGIAMVDTATGLTNYPFAVGQLVHDYGANSAILSLSSDGTQIYGTGYVFGTPGNLEGAFSASWTDGTVKWIEDCHGDTYSNAVLNGAVYIASHEHFCQDVPDGFPQTAPIRTFQRGTAFSTAVAGTVATLPMSSYTNWGGQPAPDLLNFYPTLTPGTFTGEDQAAWSVAASSAGYVTYAGEFPSVNGTAQQGLVRFANSSIAPNTDGPLLSGNGWVPSGTSYTAGSARISWIANEDRDNANLTYSVYRDGAATPIYTTSATSHLWWLRPQLNFTDTGLTPGRTYAYKISATDPFGNTVKSAGINVTVATSSTSPTTAYARDVIATGATDYWRFGDATSTDPNAYDAAGATHLSDGTGVTDGTAGAITGDPDTAATFSGATDGSSLASTQSAVTAPSTFSEEAWFKTTSTTAGELIDMGTVPTGNSINYDRSIVVGANGAVTFGVGTNNKSTIASASGYNDGKWHQVVATLSSAGMALYLDGKLVKSNAAVTAATAYSAYWRVGGDTTTGNTVAYFTGSIDDVAIYPTALTAAQVAEHLATAQGLNSTVAPTASFTATPSNLTASFDATASTATNATITSYAWTFGDGTTGTGATPTHTYAAGGTYSVGLTVTDSNGGTATALKSVTITAPNVAPTAAFTASSSGLTATFDGSTSKDSDGSIASYSWNFGDGTAAGSGVAPTHVYGQAGTYQVALTVTDNGGATNTVTQQVVITAPNAAPTSSFTESSSLLVASFDGTGSSDTDGTIASYAWTFGDGGTSTASAPTHTYAAGGTYSVTLTVTDNGGATGTSTQSITVAAANVAPTASFTGSTNNLTASFNASASSDPDGTVASYAWNFGDGSTGSGVTTTHAYTVAGQYTVTLTVTDNQGATGTTSQQITVSNPPANVPPTAAFTATSTNLSVAFDGTSSSDTDGTIASYSWNFGDGSTSTAPRPTHVYAAAGTFTVGLTVTDNGGATGSTTQQVTVTAATTGATTVASDDFGRTATSGLGTADIGGAYTVTGTKSLYSVSSGAAQLSDAKGVTLLATLGSTSLTDSDVSVASSISALPVGGSAFVSLWARRVASDGYQARAIIATTGAVNLEIDHGTTSLKNVKITGLTVAAGDVLNLEISTSGTSPTTINAKVWKAGTTAPTTWQATATDSTTALQTAGSVAIGAYLGSGATNGPLVFSFDTLRATTPATGTPAPVNAAPTASFTATATNLAVAFNGTASTDTDGTIASYAWNFGDSSTGTGSTPSHTYAAAGTYPVTLTVTDNGGATGTSTQSVTVTAAAAPVNAAPTASFASSVSGLAASFDGTRSTDSDGTVQSWAWNFGDTATAAGSTTSHTYASAGTYTVTLTVTDNGGATGTSTGSVTVTAPVAPATTFAADAFGRTTTSGLGTADTGGAWTVSGGSANTAVGSGVATFKTAAAAQINAYLSSTTAPNADVATTLSLGAVPVGGTVYAGVVGRRVGSDDYNARVDVATSGAVSIEVMHGSTSLKSVKITGLTYTAGLQLRLRLQVVQTSATTTTLHARAWTLGTTEPTAWQASATDTTAALQTAGAVGLRTYAGSGLTNGPAVVTFDDFSAQPVQ